MTVTTRWKTPLVAGVLLAAVAVSGCSETTHSLSPAGLSQSAANLTDALTPSFVKSSGYSARDKECLARAMFFESKRSSRDGMIAVGTVVMNRKRSGQYPDTICGVVGQKRQFAPGVLSRPMNSKALPDVMEAAEAVLKGERHPKLKNAMHFHTAGLKFPYKNMHYVVVAGGNSFYEKRGRRWQPLPPENGILPTVMIASAPAEAVEPQPDEQPVMVASAEPREVVADTAFVPLPEEAPAFVPHKRPAVMMASAAATPRPVPRRQAVAAAEPAADRFGGNDGEPALSYGDASSGQILLLPPDDARFGN